MRKYSYTNLDGGSRAKMARRITQMKSAIMENDAKKETKTVKEGPRTIFLKKYKLTGDFEQSKKELQDQGFSSELFEDKTLQKWIDEER